MEYIQVNKQIHIKMAAICLVFLIIINIVKTEHFDIHKLRKYSHKQFSPETTKYFGYGCHFNIDFFLKYLQILYIALSYQ
jgi:hypothetical protein